MLAEARNAFKAAQDERERERQNELRRSALGFTSRAALLDGNAVEPAASGTETPFDGSASRVFGAVAAAQRASKKLKMPSKKAKAGGKTRAATACRRVPSVVTGMPSAELFSK